MLPDYLSKIVRAHLKELSNHVQERQNPLANALFDAQQPGGFGVMLRQASASVIAVYMREHGIALTIIEFDERNPTADEVKKMIGDAAKNMR